MVHRQTSTEEARHPAGEGAKEKRKMDVVATKREQRVCTRWGRRITVLSQRCLRHSDGLLSLLRHLEHVDKETKETKKTKVPTGVRDGHLREWREFNGQIQ